MIDTILGILVSMLSAFGYGTMTYFAFVFWTTVSLYIAHLKGIKTINFSTEDVKDIQEETTKES